ncbi:MarR family winged helix-turn-helix transcriptional regulator [Kitasatospora sp. NPDC088391]|uniref:MarR family winged helix-turn-helix transcriptional regulator n=1 Tax=Kitasatospora sp. NPDC088391 TaxID=3364074 RepID=UPI0037FB5BDB
MDDPVGERNAAEPAFLAVEREVATLFRRSRTRAAEVSRLVHPELEAGAYVLLAFIREAGRARVTDVGLHFGVGKATVSRQIRAIEELGLLRRETDPLDRRASLVSLTEEGERRFAAARAVRMGRFRDSLAGWELAELEQFARLLERFNELTEGV